MAAQTVVLDPGTGTIKAGLATESLPAVVFPTIVGAPTRRAKGGLLKKKGGMAEEDDSLAGKAFVVGDEALHYLSRVAVSMPMEHGIVKKWDEFEYVIHQVFGDLALQSAETVVVLTRPLFNPKDDAERWCSTLFETFEVPALGVAPQGLCALYASGRTTGIVLDSGDGLTQVTPVFDSHPIMKAANRMNMGGRQITDHLRRILFERGYNFTTTQDQLLVRQIKEDHCFVAADYSGALAAREDQAIIADVELPDGQIIKVGKERFRAPELLFNPNVLHSELPSFGDFVAAAVKRCDLDTRRGLLSNIVLSGGNTLFPGFPARLQDGVVQGFPGLFGSTKVIDPPDRKYAVWAGAAVLAGLAGFQDGIIPRAAYDEHGPSVIHGHLREPQAGSKPEAAAAAAADA